MIDGKKKVEEQCESEQKNILKYTDFQYELLSANISLNNELTLTMYNLDVKQETTAQLTSDKKKPETKLQQTSEEKHIGFQRSKEKFGSSIGKVNLRKNANQHRRTKIIKLKYGEIIL